MTAILHQMRKYVKLGIMDNELGLRERKRIARRRAIEAAAIDLFEANGFDDTTIEDIAAAVEIAPRTFFSYFPTKEDVVLADYSSRLDRIIAKLDDQPADVPPWAALRAAFTAVATDYQSQREHLIRRFTIMATAPSGWSGVPARSQASAKHSPSSKFPL